MNRSDIAGKFLDAIEYELYPFQEEALLAWFEEEGGILVTAPTGMGKTLIAEAAIFEALATGRRLYYTTPLIALTDQKFREFQDKAERWGFPREQIGLITGNRRVNPDALVRVVVAEILLNHLIGGDAAIGDTQAVVMDEFHYFNDPERGVVWELSLVLLPKHVRLMLLSATVGNPVEFMGWLSREHGRKVRLIKSEQRRVPLEFIWVGDKLLTEQLGSMVAASDEENRSPALVFCFNRDECWEVAETLKGLKLIDASARDAVEGAIDIDDFRVGVGPKLKQLLIRGVAVHHAGVLPKYKQIIEDLFLQKLIPFVVCTETLSAGVNLPARSVVLSTLMKGKPREKTLVPPSSAHQMFGRAGRPQFDKQGYVYAIAHEDDAKIAKWRKRYDQIDQRSKDPGVMRMRKEIERKKPTRRKTEQYWTEGQFKMLIQSAPQKLASRSMIPYQVLIYLLMKTGTLRDVRRFVSQRFNLPERLEKFQKQLDHMIGNLQALGYLKCSEDGEHVSLHETINELSGFRSIDPLYGVFLARKLVRASFAEKVQALESVLQIPFAIERKVKLPDMEKGPLQSHEVEPELITLGLATLHPEGGLLAVSEDEGKDYWEDDENERPLTFPEMLKVLFDAKLKTPEPVPIQATWVAGAVFEIDCDFYKFVRERDLTKNEGIILRHLLRLIILALEFLNHSDGDPDYQAIGELATRVCRNVDSRYTDRFLASESEMSKLAPI